MRRRPVIKATAASTTAGAAIAIAAGVLFGVGSAQGNPVKKLADDGQRPSVAVSQFDDSAYATWLNPKTNEPAFCLLEFSGCKTLTVLKGAPATDSADPPFVFAPQTAGSRPFVVESRSLQAFKLYLWSPLNSPTPADLGFGRASYDAALGLEGLNGNPKQGAVHAIGMDANDPARGWVHKGFPFAGTEADALADGLSLDTDHLANASIAVLRDAKTGDDARPVAVFDNNAETFFAVGRHPGDGLSPAGFRHWNTAGEWNPERKLVDGGSAKLAKAPSFSFVSTSRFFGRMVYADEANRPTVATFDVNGLILKPKVLGSYSTLSFGGGGADIQHAIVFGGDRRTYVVWVASNVFGPDSLLMSYGGKGLDDDFSAPVEIAQGEGIRNISLSVGKSRGFVTWSPSFTGSEGSPVYSTYFSGPGATAGSGSAAVSAARRKPYASKPAVKANAKVGKKGFATVLARNGCATRGRGYRVRVLVGTQRGTKKPRLSRVAVTLAGKTLTDRRGPFSVKLSTRRLKRGQSAAVRVKLLRGRTTVKTLKYRLRICG